jgi:hypothetical protein
MKKVMATAVAFFSLLQSCVVAQLHKEGDGSCRRLLLSIVELCYSASEEGDYVVELRCNALEEGVSVVELRYNVAQQSKQRQQRCSRLLLSLLKVQLHEKGNGRCRHLLLLLFCSFFFPL